MSNAPAATKPKRSRSKLAKAVDAALEEQNRLEPMTEPFLHPSQPHIGERNADGSVSILDMPEVEGLISDDVLTDARNNLIDATETYAKLDDSAGILDTKVSLEEYIERGKDARLNMEGGKWQLCYLAAEVVKSWGDHSLDEWAAGVGIGSSTARRYRQFELFYPMEGRLAFCDKHQNPDGKCAVYFSHFTQAMVLPTPEIAYEWLAIVANAPHWSVDEAGMELEKWIQLRGYQKRAHSKSAVKTKVELCKNLMVNHPDLSQLNGEWFLTLRITDDDEIVKALEPTLRANKLGLLKLTLTKTV